MPLQGRSNSSSEGGRSGRSKSMNMRGFKLAKRLPHLNAVVDGTLSNPLGREPILQSTTSGTGIQTYTVPSGVDTLTITMYGAGGGGGRASGGRSGTTNGEGAGGGAKCVFVLNEIRTGTVLTFNVGAGGAKSTGSNGSDGGDTTLTFSGTTYTAGGGKGGKDAGSACPDCGDGGTATNGDTNTSGNDHSSENGGAVLGDSAGAGGDGSTNDSSQNHTDGGNGKVIVS